MARKFFAPGTPLRMCVSCDLYDQYHASARNSSLARLYPSGQTWVIETPGWSSAGGYYEGSAIAAALAVENLADGQVVTRCTRATGYTGTVIGVRFSIPFSLAWPDQYYGVAPFSSGYSVLYGYVASTSDVFRLTRELTSLGSTTTTVLDSWIRIQCVGTAIKVRRWDADSSEPDGWTFEVTDATYSSGGIGFGAGSYFSARTSYIYGIGVDYGSTNAPTAGGLKTISGQATMGGSPVNGAKIIAVRHGVDLTKPLIPGIDVAEATTNAQGNYSISLDTDAGPWHVAARHEVGGQKYTAEGKPYIVLS